MEFRTLNFNSSNSNLQKPGLATPVPKPTALDIARQELLFSFYHNGITETSNLIKFYQYLRGEIEECPQEYENSFSITLHIYNKTLCEMLHSKNKVNINELFSFKDLENTLNQLISGFPNLEFLKSTIIPPYLSENIINLSQILTHLYFNNKPSCHWNLCSPILNFGIEAMYNNEDNFKRRINSVKYNYYDELVLYSFIPDERVSHVCDQIKHLLGYPLEDKEEIEYFITHMYTVEFPTVNLVETFNMIRENNIEFRKALKENDITQQEICINIIKEKLPPLEYLFSETLEPKHLHSLIIPYYSIKQEAAVSEVDLISMAKSANLPNHCYWNCFNPLYNYALDAMFSCDYNLKTRATFANCFGQSIL